MSGVPILGFYHIAYMQNTDEVVNEQLDLLESSGLLEASERVYCTVLGDGWEPRLEHPKFSVFTNESILHFEFPTLSLLWHQAQEKECLCYYIHTKGVRLGNPPSIRDWRKMMQYFVVERWQDAVKKLDEGYDCVGTDWGWMPWEPPRNFGHFAGNFFWTKSEHVRGLPAIETLDLSHRELAEAWLSMSGIPNYYEAFHSGIDHNAALLPREAYEGKGYA